MSLLTVPPFFVSLCFWGYPPGMKSERTISVLERWEGSGAVWEAVRLSDELAVLDLCTCYGEPVGRIETRDRVCDGTLRLSKARKAFRDWKAAFKRFGL